MFNSQEIQCDTEAVSRGRERNGWFLIIISWARGLLDP